MKCLSTFICCGKAFDCTLTQAWWFRGGPKFGKLGSGGAKIKMTSWCHSCWGCKPPHSASHIHNTYIWSVWAPSYAVEWHLSAPLHRHDGSGWGKNLENWGQAELRRHCFDFVEAVNHHTLHHTSIIHVYEVFEQLHMLWKGIWVHPYTGMMVQGGAKLWKIGVWRSQNDIVVSLLRL